MRLRALTGLEREKLEKEYFWDGFCDEYADSGESVYTEELENGLRLFGLEAKI